MLIAHRRHRERKALPLPDPVLLLGVTTMPNFTLKNLLIKLHNRD